MGRGKWCRCSLGLYIVFNEGVFLVNCQSNCWLGWLGSNVWTHKRDADFWKETRRVAAARERGAGGEREEGRGEKAMLSNVDRRK